MAFESLVKDGVEVAAHADIEDEGQTVHFVDIGTTAADAADGDKLVTGSEVIIADEVSFEGLIPGNSYTLEATLMDAETGEPLQNGKGPLATDVAATVEFTPEAAEGTQTVELSFDSSGLGGHRLVVFEKLLEANAPSLRCTRISRTMASPSRSSRSAPRSSTPPTATHGRERDGRRRGYRRVLRGSSQAKPILPTAPSWTRRLAMPLEDSEGNPVTSTAEFVAESSRREP